MKTCGTQGGVFRKHAHECGPCLKSGQAVTAAPEAETAAPAGGDRRGVRPGRDGGCAVTGAMTA